MTYNILQSLCEATASESHCCEERLRGYSLKGFEAKASKAEEVLPHPDVQLADLAPVKLTPRLWKEVAELATVVITHALVYRPVR